MSSLQMKHYPSKPLYLSCNQISHEQGSYQILGLQHHLCPQLLCFHYQIYFFISWCRLSYDIRLPLPHPFRLLDRGEKSCKLQKVVALVRTSLEMDMLGAMVMLARWMDTWFPAGRMLPIMELKVYARGSMEILPLLVLYAMLFIFVFYVLIGNTQDLFRSLNLILCLRLNKIA